nr:uncharacterized protein LOC109176714 [Ipomoea batatas]
MGDPGAFVVPCMVKDLDFDNALVGLEALIGIVLLFVFDRLLFVGPGDNAMSLEGGVEQTQGNFENFLEINAAERVITRFYLLLCTRVFLMKKSPSRSSGNAAGDRQQRKRVAAGRLSRLAILAIGKRSGFGLSRRRQSRGQWLRRFLPSCSSSACHSRVQSDGLHISVPDGRRESGDHRRYYRRNEVAGVVAALPSPLGQERKQTTAVAAPCDLSFEQPENVATVHLRKRYPARLYTTKVTRLEITSYLKRSAAHPSERGSHRWGKEVAELHRNRGGHRLCSVDVGDAHGLEEGDTSLASADAMLAGVLRLIAAASRRGLKAGYLLKTPPTTRSVLLPGTSLGERGQSFRCCGRRPSGGERRRCRGRQGAPLLPTEGGGGRGRVVGWLRRSAPSIAAESNEEDRHRSFLPPESLAAAWWMSRRRHKSIPCRLVLTLDGGRRAVDAPLKRSAAHPSERGSHRGGKEVAELHRNRGGRRLCSVDVGDAHGLEEGDTSLASADAMLAGVLRLIAAASRRGLKAGYLLKTLPTTRSVLLPGTSLGERGQSFRCCGRRPSGGECRRCRGRQGAPLLPTEGGGGRGRAVGWLRRSAPSIAAESNEEDRHRSFLPPESLAAAWWTSRRRHKK